MLLIVLTFLLISEPLVKIACSTGSPSKMSFYFLKPFSSFLFSTCMSWLLGGSVSPSVVGWLSATAREICHSVTALNIDWVGEWRCRWCNSTGCRWLSHVSREQCCTISSVTTYYTTQQLSLLSHPPLILLLQRDHSLDECLVLVE